MNVIITGALGGIGTAVAQLFKRSSNNWNVIGIDYQQTTAHDLDYYYQIDLSQDNISTEITNIYQRHEPTCIVHCAALQYCSEIDQVNLQDNWRKLMNVNVKSIYSMIQLAIPYMKKQHRGNIVIISSVHAVSSSKNISLYATSKCALTGLVRNSAIELAPYGIRVNAIAPGAVNTPMLMDGLSRGSIPKEEAFKRLINAHPTKRILEPIEIANIVYFLSTPVSSAINGQTLIADGGVSCVLSTETGYSEE